MKKIIITIIIIILGITGTTIYYLNNKTENIELLENTDSNILIEEPIIKEEIQEEVKKYITVEIKGEVINPGVYKIEENSRVIDLINLSGGLTQNALTININQAKKLKDEMVIVIYNINDLKEEVKTEYVYLECECPKVTNDGCINEEETNEIINEKISINNGTLEELMSIKGIGEKTAEKIIEYRKENKFDSIEDIKNVSGIGESLYEKIKDSITI